MPGVLPGPTCDIGAQVRSWAGLAGLTALDIEQPSSLSERSASAWSSLLTMYTKLALGLCAACQLAPSTTMLSACGAGTRLAARNIVLAAVVASPLIVRQALQSRPCRGLAE